MAISLKSNSSSLFVVEKAFVADRREKPVRWLVVSLTMMFTFFALLVGVLFIEQIGDIKKQL